MTANTDLRYTIVIPTTGRHTLTVLLAALGDVALDGTAPEEIVVVDDRPQPDVAESDVAEPAVPIPMPRTPAPIRVLRSGGRGPAGARNAGWQAARTPWVVFLDDDVIPGPDWGDELHVDLAGMAWDMAASQGRIVVPVPEQRAPTDLERGTAGLAHAYWITADMAYRRDVLAEVGGFDETFPRAFREDADLAMRVQRNGYELAWGMRTTTHPVRPDGFFASVRAQAGNADNAVMRRRYGKRWRHSVGEGPGRTTLHTATTAAGLTAVLGAAVRPIRPVAVVGFLVWLGLTAEFAWRRIAPGPRTGAEILRMAVTSVAIPPVACWHRARGELRARLHPHGAPHPDRQPEQRDARATADPAPGLRPHAGQVR